VCRAELALLQKDLSTGSQTLHLGADLVHARSYDDGDVRTFNAFCQRENVAQHRSACHLMEDLGHRGVHPRASAGGKDDNQRR
jgi:hypothetical protein